MEELQVLEIKDFAGGLNDWASSYALADNEAAECMNCRVDEQGMLQKRQGRGAAVSISGLNGTHAYNGAARLYTNPAVTTNIVGSGKATLGLVYKAGVNAALFYGTTAPTTTLHVSHMPSAGSNSPFEITGRMRVVQWGNSRVYLAMGQTHALRWGLATTDANPSFLDDNVLRNVHEMGVAAIGSAGTAAEGDACAVGGTTAGHYRYGITLTYGPLGAWGESVATETAAYEHIDDEKKYKLSAFTDLYTSATDNYRCQRGVYSMKVYRTEAQSSSADATNAPLYFLFEETDITLAPATGWQYIDSEYTVDVATPAPTAYDTGDLPHDGNDAKIAHMCAHNARMYVCSEEVADATDTVVDDTVYYSNEYMPDEFPTQNWFRVQGRVMGMWSASYGLVVFTSKSIFVWRGYGPGSFQIEEVQGVQGCVASDSIATIKMRGKQVIAYAGEDGIYGFDGYTSEFLGLTRDGAGMKVGTTWGTYASNKANARGIAYKHYYLLAYQDSRDSGSYNNRVLAYDTRYDCWWPWDNWDVGGWCHFHGDGDSDELYYGSSAIGEADFYQCMTGTEFCRWYWTSRDYPLEGAVVQVQARKCWVELEDDSLPIDVYVRIDGGDLTDGYSLPGASDLATWDTVAWDDFTWERQGTETVNIGKSLEDSLIGKRVGVKLDKEDSENKKIIGITVGYYIRGRL